MSKVSNSINRFTLTLHFLQQPRQQLLQQLQQQPLQQPLQQLQQQPLQQPLQQQAPQVSVIILNAREYKIAATNKRKLNTGSPVRSELGKTGVSARIVSATRIFRLSGSG